MDKVMKLTKVFLRNSLSDMDTRMGVSMKSKMKFLLYGFLGLYFAGLIIFFAYNILTGLIAIQQEAIFIALILMITFGVALAQTIFSSVNVLYFTKDNEYLLPLPLKPYQIILARTNVILLTQYMLIFLVGLIPLIMYGIFTGAGIAYYFIMLLAVILIPILPVLIINIIVMCIMSFARLTKNRNRFQFIASLLVLAIVIVFSLAISGTRGDLTNEEMVQMLVQANGMIEVLKGYIPTVDFFIEALTTSSIGIAALEVLKALAITIVGFIVYIFLSQKIYLKGLVGNLFGGNSKKSIKKLSQKAYQNNKLYKSYIGKEFKTLLRNPIFFMQCLLPAILMPVLMIVISYMGMQSSGDQMGEMMQMFEQLPSNTFTVACVILGVIQFFSMFIYVSITAISRDGENAVFIKYVPISLYKQYLYKIVPNVIMNVITILITLLIAEYILRLPIVTFLLLLLVATIIGILQSILMFIIDLKKPKLNWDSEYVVVKQNLNLIFPVLFSMINIFVIIILYVLLKDINVYAGIIIVGIIYSIITMIANNYLYRNQYSLADKIL